MSFFGIASVAICSGIDEGIFLKAIFVLCRIRIFHVLYNRLDKATNFAWLFFLCDVVSAQVPGKRNPTMGLHCILLRSATL